MANPIRHIRKRRENSPANQRAVIERSGLFVAEWYAGQYPDARTAPNALDHYLTVGEDQGYQPNPFFDPKWYRSRVEAANKDGVSALAHYALKGWRNGKHPSPAFSLKLYFDAYGESVGPDIDPLFYHLSRGQFEGKAAFHLSLQSGHDQTVQAMKEIAASGLFHREWYLAYYSDLWSLRRDPLQHFVQTGSAEGRNPNSYFETHWYQKRYNLLPNESSETVETEEDDETAQLYSDLPVLHYIRQGALDDFATGPQFDGTAYSKENPDAREAPTPLTHLLGSLKENGLRELTRPSDIASATEVKAGAKLPVADHIRAAMHCTEAPLSPATTSFNPNGINIHWVMPDFAPGAGGHMTIFRMVHFLEVMGHKQTIWINNPTQHSTEDEAYQTILKHFQHFGGDVRFVDEDFAEVAEGDALIATDCWSVYPVVSAPKFLKRFYFVQDHEPSFHAVGAEHILAEQTYKFDLDCICASPWLADMMRETYGRTASHFWLAADKKLYWPPSQPRQSTVPRIAVYARHFTARRAVELALLALENLAERDINFHVDFFGADLDLIAAPFPVTDHGVASPEALASLFRAADIGLVFSATNYSLVPQEMMASGLPIVELGGESTRAIFPDETVTLAEPHPTKISDALYELLTDQKKRIEQANSALEWVTAFSWPKSAKAVESSILDGLTSVSKAQTSAAKATGLVSKAQETDIKASVVIPTYNAGESFRDVLKAATEQEAPWAYEILVIDSGSTDETLDIIKEFPDVQLHEIKSKDFNHGGTRNLGAELTCGDFIAYLTHDALPYNSRWLYNMVSALEHYPDAAGAFGKHFAHEHASAFTKKELNAHFNMFDGLPLEMSRDTDRKRWNDNDTQWRQVLHFYSDNNSCFRREIWEKIPYQNAAFGEDQLWANDIIEAGYSKLYVPKAIVYHSHDYGVEETFERAKTESAFFKHFFGYCLMENTAAVEKACQDFDKDDVRFADENNLPQSELEERRKLLRARFEGYLAGSEADTRELF